MLHVKLFWGQRIQLFVLGFHFQLAMFVSSMCHRLCIHVDFFHLYDLYKAYRNTCRTPMSYALAEGSCHPNEVFSPFYSGYTVLPWVASRCIQRQFGDYGLKVK